MWYAWITLECGTEVTMALEQRAARHAPGSLPRPSLLIRDLLTDKWDRIGAWLSVAAVGCFGLFFAVLLIGA